MVQKGQNGMIDLDEVFDQLNKRYLELNGHMARTGCQLLDWAREQGLITDDQRDLYYMEGAI